MRGLAQCQLYFGVGLQQGSLHTRIILHKLFIDGSFMPRLHFPLQAKLRCSMSLQSPTVSSGPGGVRAVRVLELVLQGSGNTHAFTL